MLKLKKCFNALAALSVTILLTACSGSSGGGSGPASIGSQFIDDPVKGILVQKASGDAVTAAEGRFSCVSGETLTFLVAGLKLGSSACDSKIFVDQIGANWQKAAFILQFISASEPGSGELDVSRFSSSTELAGLDLTNDGEAAIKTVMTTASMNTNAASVTLTVAAATTNAAASSGKFPNTVFMTYNDGERKYAKFGSDGLTASYIKVGSSCQETVTLNRIAQSGVFSAVDLQVCVEESADDEVYENNSPFTYIVTKPFGSVRIIIRFAFDPSDGSMDEEYCIVDDENDTTCNDEE
jgi:hypothetical protein